MSKSSQAFRTIREVADWLDVAAHVLRFWESKFPQIKPVKRAGGRRYYRPADMELVGGIKVLLHDRGLTIRGVQKMITEEGVAAVAALSPPIDLDDGMVIEGDSAAEWLEDAAADAADVVPAPAAGGDAAPAAPEPATEPERQPRLMLEEPQAEPATDAPAEAEPEFHAVLSRLTARLADGPPLPAAVMAQVRPALRMLRDRMQADPPA
jgi:DNA-binding transcriptional MerR regulator